MKHTTLIVPGYLGSGPAHWQSWLERQLPEAERVKGIDWNAPIIDRWAAAVGRAIDHAHRPVWLVAHSFGCLAGLLAASSRPGCVAGALLVAPADPGRFSEKGLLSSSGVTRNIAHRLQDIRLDCPGLVVASANDPWMNFSTAAYWAQRWGCRLVNLGNAGHINAESGYGPWPVGLKLLRDMQSAHGGFLLGTIDIQRSPIQAV